MIKKNLVIFRQENSYSAFPSIIKFSGQELLVLFRSAPWREHIMEVKNPHARIHVDPEAGLFLVRTKDAGKTWSAPVRIVGKPDSECTNPGIIFSQNRTLYLAFQGCSWNLEKKDDAFYNPDFFDKYRHSDGVFLTRSFDGGNRWEDSPACIVSHPEKTGIAFGFGCELTDGSLLLPMYGTTEGKDFCFLMQSSDRGNNWEYFSTIAADAKGRIFYQEPALLNLGDGKLLCLMRISSPEEYFYEAEVPAQVSKIERYLYQSFSDDNGLNWTEPEKTPMWGFPANLLKLKNGSVLATYGYRRPPYGIRGCLSRDAGKKWDIEHEIIIRDDGWGSDLGYPTSIQLDSGEIFTVYYFDKKERPGRYIEGTVFTV